MRRRGLREWIRHQRRLTRRLVTRHVLARRPNSIARTLERLGAWFDDRPIGALRFVPPLIEGDAASAAAAVPAMASALSGVPDEHVEIWEGSPSPTVAAADDEPDTPN